MDPKTRIPSVRPREAVSASTMNAIIAALAAGPGGLLRGGPGIDVSNEAGGVTISLAGKLLGEIVPARIVAATGQPIDRAENIRYDVVAISRPTVRLDGATPYWGRPTRQAQTRIHAAPVDGLCWIVLEPIDNGSRRGLLWLPAGGPGGECYAERVCGQNFGSAPEGQPPQLGPDGLPIVPPPPPPPPPTTSPPVFTSPIVES